MEEDIDYGNPDKYINDESIEMAWAIQAAERASIHMNLIICCNTTVLRLNREQDEILRIFRQHFPDLGVSKVTYRELKEDGRKEKWREFCEIFKEKVDDYSMGTLMRIDAQKAYSPDNTVVVPKIIYLAVEMARNVEGINEEAKASYTAHHNSLDTLS